MKKLVQLVLDMFDSRPVVGQYQHPRANRSLKIANTVVAYEFKRSRRKTIGMLVGVDGLEVRAPRWVRIQEVESTLHEKADWIIRKLSEMQVREKKLAANTIQWCEGAVIPYMGDTLVIALDPTHEHQKPNAKLQTVKEASDGSRQHILYIGLPHAASSEQLRDATQAWLMKQAKQIFTERLNHFAPLLGVQWTRLSLSNANTRWGSASTGGSIRLSWRLIHFKIDVIDYVVAHELSHLQVMDHSARFWDTVETVIPDYVNRRMQLKDESIPRWR